MICLDDSSVQRKLLSKPRTNPTVPILPDSLCYIIYTSGSTGRPKGVGVHHKNLAHYVQCALKKLIKPNQFNIGYLNTISTDLGHTVLFGSILSGKKLIILKSEQELDINETNNYLAQYQIELIKIVPSYFEMLKKENFIGQHVTYILGGEKLLDRGIKNTNIINHYGPTETTVGSIVNNRNNQMI